MESSAPQADAARPADGDLPPRGAPASAVSDAAVDAVDPASARVPEKFKALHLVSLPGGEPPEGFVKRLAALVAAGDGA